MVAETIVLDVHCNDRADTSERCRAWSPISARSRSPATLSIEIDSSSILAWSSLRTGVLPTLTTCFGLWTDVAGLVSRVPPETIQSKHLLIAERCCLTEGRERGSCST